ncbi:hypothetical protein M422DRAFT_52411 [Sphaerobolus stellatus SS14]|uniref:Uncharacterized protein n=1 Tax=Sphaerobolus stellatus (strain SS14) TaxID=990650 RepID=A0A0C9UW23_SPHS4|nr:hypothetical protein M422DRAFT_52411 [Sphaerobolus stellatus SS14]
MLARPRTRCGPLVDASQVSEGAATHFIRVTISVRSLARYNYRPEFPRYGDEILGKRPRQRSGAGDQIPPLLAHRNSGGIYPLEIGQPIIFIENAWVQQTSIKSNKALHNSLRLDRAGKSRCTALLCAADTDDTVKLIHMVSMRLQDEDCSSLPRGAPATIGITLNSMPHVKLTLLYTGSFMKHEITLKIGPCPQERKLCI